MIFVITGPTCLGKSDSAVIVAKLFNAEIVNGDAFQIYQEMDIGVAKPEPELMKQVPHHLYSIISPDSSFSIMDYQKLLRSKIDEIISRGKNVVIVGGSGLYIRSALYDYTFTEEEPYDTSEYDKLSNEELYALLVSKDSEAAKILHPNNRRRVLRAIVICETSGKTKSEIIDEQKHEPIYEGIKFFVRDMDRAELYDRINKRVDIMFDLGLENEVKNLVSNYGTNIQAMQAIGYKEFKDYFDGTSSLEDTKELIKKNTRNYAKRQMTYIRHQFPVLFYKDNNELIHLIEN